MRLSEWFETSALKKGELATALGVTPATVTNLLNGEQKWISRGLALRIAEVTGGAVTANDFMGTKS